MNRRGTPVRTAGDRVEIDVWVVPGSSRPGVGGLHDGAVRVRVGAPPEGGKANREAAGLLAKAAGGRRGTVVRGAASRRKVVAVTGVACADAVAALRRAGVPV